MMNADKIRTGGPASANFISIHHVETALLA